MPVERETFTAVFTEFSDAAAYPVPALEYWLEQANAIFPDGSLGHQTSMAAMLWAAHNLSLNRAAARGGGSLAAVAPATSKGVGPVSKSVDLGSIVGKDAGIYAATSYGLRLVALLQGLVTGGLYAPSRKALTIRRAERLGRVGGPFGL